MAYQADINHLKKNYRFLLWSDSQCAFHVEDPEDFQTNQLKKLIGLSADDYVLVGYVNPNKDHVYTKLVEEAFLEMMINLTDKEIYKEKIIHVKEYIRIYKEGYEL